MYPKLASHKFCNSLMARHHKVCAMQASPHTVRCGTPHASSMPSFPRLLPRTWHAACGRSSFRGLCQPFVRRLCLLTLPASAPRTTWQYVRRKARGLTGAQISRCACPPGFWFLVLSLLVISLLVLSLLVHGLLVLSLLVLSLLVLSLRVHGLGVLSTLILSLLVLSRLILPSGAAPEGAAREACAMIGSLRMMGGVGLLAEKAAASGGAAGGSTAVSGSRKPPAPSEASACAPDEAGGAQSQDGQRGQGGRQCDTEAAPMLEGDKSSCASPADAGWSGGAKRERTCTPPIQSPSLPPRSSPPWSLRFLF